ncbi:MAG: CPBP family intramembrane metalloprotease [Myxococcales bacterium]|nr:CPBP family intramembrane metalloprotease [Myxococcales bacterium]
MKDQRSATPGLVVLAIGLGIATCGLVAPRASDPLEALVVSAVGFEVLFAMLAFAGAAQHPSPVRRLGLQPGRMSAGWVVAAAIGTIGLSQALDWTLEWLGVREQSVLADLDDMLRGANGRALWFSVVGLGLIPAFGEELLCRGLLQRGLAERYGALLAVVASAAFFGALHLEWIQGGSAFVLGLYIGTVAHLAGSIRPAIACHAANNLVAVGVGSLDFAGFTGFGAVGTSLATAATGMTVAALALALVVWHMRRLSR